MINLLSCLLVFVLYVTWNIFYLAYHICIATNKITTCVRAKKGAGQGAADVCYGSLHVIAIYNMLTILGNHGAFALLFDRILHTKYDQLKMIPKSHRHVHSYTKQNKIYFHNTIRTKSRRYLYVMWYLEIVDALVALATYLSSIYYAALNVILLCPILQNDSKAYRGGADGSNRVYKYYSNRPRHLLGYRVHAFQSSPLTVDYKKFA